MKILIAYATKSGASRACAQALAKLLDGAEAVDLSRESPSAARYDAVIIGTGIRIGRAYRPAVRFMREQLASLLERPVGIYLCNAEPETYEKAVLRSVPPGLLSHAACVRSLGGIMPFSRSPQDGWMKEEAVAELAAAVKARIAGE